MLDPSALSIASNRVSLDMRDRRDAFLREIRAVKGRLSARGVLTSSFAQQDIAQSIAAEFLVRVSLIWQALSRVLSSVLLDLDPHLGDEIKAFVKSALEMNCEDLKREYTFAEGLMPDVSSMVPIEALEERALQRASSDVDLALLEAKRRASTGANTTVNIFQPVGIVQTGSGSTATFNQSFGEIERRELDRALTAVAKAVDGTALESDALEIVGDARAEIAKAKPNVARLRGSLTALATTVQTMGSAAAAYQILKGAAALVGVTLP